MPRLRAETVEVAFTLVALFMFSGALIGPLASPDQALTDDVPALRLMWLPLYAGILAAAALRLPYLFEAAPAAALFMAPAAFALMSRVWSIDPGVTTRRGVALLMTTLFGLWFAARWSDGAKVRMAASVLVALAAGSLLAALLDPALGVQHDINAGDWRGLWYEKNAMGAAMATGAVAAFAAGLVSPRRWAWWAGAALCGVMAVKARSTTALVCLLVPAAAYPLVLAARRGGPALAVAFAATGAAALAGLGVALLAPALLFRALGKDETLTGRTEIWAALLRRAHERPWLGYGYGAFWEKDSVPARVVQHEAHWSVPSAHNGWLDVVVQLGWVGGGLTAAVAAAALAAALVRGWRLGDGGLWLMVVLTFLLRAASESVLLAQNGLDWMLFVAAGASLLAGLRWSRAEGRAPGPPYARPAWAES